MAYWNEQDEDARADFEAQQAQDAEYDTNVLATKSRAQRQERYVQPSYDDCAREEGFTFWD